jgi:hypothetical protein
MTAAGYAAVSETADAIRVPFKKKFAGSENRNK